MVPELPYLVVHFDVSRQDEVYLWQGVVTDEFGVEVPMNLELHQQCVQLRVCLIRYKLEGFQKERSQLPRDVEWLLSKPCYDQYFLTPTTKATTAVIPASSLLEIRLSKQGALLASGSSRYPSLDEYVTMFGAPLSQLRSALVWAFADPIADLVLLVEGEEIELCGQCRQPLQRDCSGPF